MKKLTFYYGKHKVIIRGEQGADFFILRVGGLNLKIFRRNSRKTIVKRLQKAWKKEPIDLDKFLDAIETKAAIEVARLHATQEDIFTTTHTIQTND